MLAVAATVLAGAAAAVALGLLDDGVDDGGQPTVLVDGSTALAEPAGLPRGVRGVLRLLRAEAVEPARLRACLALVGIDELPARTVVVERIGVDGRTLTFRDTRVRRLYACDASARAEEPRVGGWCGGAAATLVGRRLTDPRLDLANCRDRRARPVAFAWVEPPQHAQWLAVARDGAPEYHRVGGDRPIRIAAASAVSGPASAVFRVRAYGPGVDHRERIVRASVAG